jgi:hypothetical protein
MAGMESSDKIGILSPQSGAVLLSRAGADPASPEAYGCDVKVAAVQHDIVWEDRGANWRGCADDRSRG